MPLQDEYQELVLLPLHLRFYFLRSITSKVSEYGFVASITILFLNSSDRNDRNTSLFLHGKARSITSPNAIVSSTVIALAPAPRDSTNS